MANGSFSIQLSGSDVANLSNIKYSIPLTPLGFSVQPNSSPDFANIPAGTYTVKVEAHCGTGTTSKNTTVTVGGAYIQPAMLASQWRGSLSCGKYGQMSLSLSGSSFPYTINILSHPAAYTGATVFTTTLNNKMLDSLPAGTYTLQMVDTCGTATPAQQVVINSLTPSSVPLDGGGISPDGNGCNKLRLFKPSVALSNNPDWQGYYMADSLFRVAYSIDGGATISPFEEMDYNFFSIVLPPGKTYKDLYGKSYIMYIKPPCGPVFQDTGNFGTLNLQVSGAPNCNNGFTAGMNVYGSITCYPLTFTLKNNSTNVTYGPYTSNGGGVNTPLLPYGSYTVSYATADGYTGMSGLSPNAPGANPYSIIYDTESYGLDNYISRFVVFYPGGIPAGSTIQLVSGPPGYAYQGTMMGGSSFFIYGYANQAPATSSNAYFKPGTYVWQITDQCGTYTVTTQVPQTDVYHYTMNLGNRVQTCNGLKVYPAGGCIYKGNNVPVFFKVLSGPPGYSSNVVPAGSPFTLSVKGTYVIGISASPTNVNSYGSYPNAYQVTDTIVYNHEPLTVDVNKTQGFLCIGASAGQGQIGIKGTGGAPYKFPSPHYNYYLAAPGNGVSGPYLSSNTTGYFAGMGMNANDLFDLKIEDSCGAFVTQQVKILDLSTAQLAAVSSPDICEGETLSLFALPLPAATYSWTGPNGFTSNQQNPVIGNVGMAAAGQYTVTITTVYCSVPASSSVDVVVHPAPAKAVVSITCTDTSAILSATGVPGAGYQWYKNGSALAGETGTVYTVKQPGVYLLHTIFPATGCYTASDTVEFSAPPGVADTPSVSGATILCAHDTALLKAHTKYPAVSYQWYRDGVLIPNATDSILFTPQPGKFMVKTSTGPCSEVVSQAVVLEKKVPPAVIRAVGDTVVCEGEEVVLFGNSGNGFSYTWRADGDTVNGSGNVFRASRSGVYTLEIYNGYCTNLSNVLRVTVNERPVAALSPGSDVYICEGDHVQLVTPPGKGYVYRWIKDGTVIPGATGNTYTTSVSGTYTVIAGNGKCPDDTSSANVYVLPYPPAGITIDGPTEFCSGLSSVLKLPYQPSYSYQWYRNGAEIPSANTYEYVVSVSGHYKATVANHSCTTPSEEIEIIVHPLPEPAIARMENVLSTGLFPSYQWHRNGEEIAGETWQEYNVTAPGYYTVSVTDSNGCVGLSDTADVVNLDEGCIVRLPSAFSPNGDGKNDLFRLIGFDAYTLYEFRVVNRWGQVVFSTTDKSEGWDGTFGGVQQEPGTYFYFARYKCDAEGKTRLRKGDVLLTR